MFSFLKREKEIKEIIDLRMAENMAKIDMDFKFLESMQRLEIKNGDILVLRYPGVLPRNTASNLRKIFQETIKDFGYDVRILVLEEGMEIGTLRKEFA